MQTVTLVKVGWPTYLAVFYAYFSFAVLFQLYPPLFENLMAEFEVSRQGASLVMSLFMAPMIVLAVPAGLAVDRFGVLRIGWAAFATLTVGALISATAASFSVFLLGRAISGTGGFLAIIAILKIVTQRFAKERLGLALGVFAAGLPAGTGVAFNLLSVIGQNFGWRATTLAGAFIAVSAVPVFNYLTKRYPMGMDSATTSVNMARVFGNGEMWRISIVTIFGYTAIIAFTTWAPITLVEYASIPLWVSSALASFLLIVDIPFAPLWGNLSDRVGKRKPFIIAAFVIFLVGSLIVPPIAQAPVWAVPGLLLVIGAMGVGCAMFFPAALAIPAENVGAELAGAAYGMLFMAQVAGMMGGPVILGFVLDHTSTYIGFLSISLVTLAGLLSSLPLKTR